ncbi:MAG: preprotein translocase subunit SecE [Lysobacteraceae bacterium]|nr:preprotein translocase subunit SecE [Xanthomonadales bacterium]MCP5477923.1 preprotein translocase subunit SecE [Rhodanobacteraceae bacterium]HPF74900.1 preprotein translocase subunit SecE [Xanthomonadaceae bacterium]
MKAKVEHQTGSAATDFVKYALSLLILAASIYGFYMLQSWPAPLRSLVPVVGVIVAALVFAFTAKGRQTLEFMSEARFELRKVIWPTRQETIQGTGIILVVVVIVSLILSLIDFLLSAGIRVVLS